jgi:Flp pilus assembly pilin Flp
MKAEFVLLKTLFAVAVIACVLTMGAMVTTSVSQMPVTAIAASR